MKNIKSWEDLKREFPMYRDEMTKEQEREFVQHCFDLYEKEGFSKVFWSIGGDFPEHIGKSFKVIGRVTEDIADLECLPMWSVQFEDGDEIKVYADEIIPSEMIENGCKVIKM
jgi:hypothetical protein